MLQTGQWGNYNTRARQQVENGASTETETETETKIEIETETKTKKPRFRPFFGFCAYVF